MSESLNSQESAGFGRLIGGESGAHLIHPATVSAGQCGRLGDMSDGSASVETHASTPVAHPSEDHEILPDWLKNRRTLILLKRPDDRSTLARRWLKGRRRVGSAITYAYEIERFFAWCDRRGIDVLEAEREHIDDYRQGLLDRHEDSTVAKKLSALSSFYKYGLSERRPIVEDNPVAAVGRPGVSRDSKTAGLDADEVLRVMGAAETLPARDRAVVHVLYATGARISELCGARAAKLRTVKGHLQMEVTRKGGKKDWLTMNAEAAQSLRVYLDGREDGPLFIGVRGEAISRYEVADVLARLVKAAGVEGKTITPHSMRHTYATMSLDAGADIRDVQESMGHASIETTMRYNRARSSVERAPTHLLTWRKP